MARRLHMTPAQTLLRWSVQQGVVAIPKSTRRERVRENSLVLAPEFALDAAAVSALDALRMRRPPRKIVSRDRVSCSLDEEAAGRGRKDGYKLTAAGVANVFPTSLHAGRTFA